MREPAENPPGGRLEQGDHTSLDHRRGEVGGTSNRNGGGVFLAAIPRQAPLLNETISVQCAHRTRIANEQPAAIGVQHGAASLPAVAMRRERRPAHADSKRRGRVRAESCRQPLHRAGEARPDPARAARRIVRSDGQPLKSSSSLRAAIARSSPLQAIMLVSPL
jgi:hypothetical protein